MEVLLKIGIAIVVCVMIYYQIAFLKWTWSTQIDPKATFSRLLKKASPSIEVIAARDPDKIYQDGNIVGEITGTIETEGDIVIFKQLSETSKLNRGVPFEHKRDRYQIVKITRAFGLKIVASNTGSEQKSAVLEEVFCKRLKQ